MEDILKALLEAQSGGRQPQQSGQPDILGDLLGGLIGGAQAPQQQRQQQAPAGGLGDIGDILGMIMGGAQAPAQGAAPENALGGLGGILGGLLGGGQRNPLADILAEKTGLHPAIASAIVAYFLSKVMGGGQSAGRSSGASPAGGLGGLNLDHLLDMMDNDDGIDNHIAASSMPRELAQQTGIDEGTAAHGLQELVKILGGERRLPKPVTNRNTGLESLLDNWETD